MLFTAPLHEVAGTETERTIALEHLNRRYAPQLERLRQALNEPRHDARAPVPSKYICLGCQVAEGEDRSSILAFAICAPYAQAAETLVGHQLMPYAYHRQAYEKNADPGPGGVIGIRKLGGIVHTPLDPSCSTALKMWQWVNKETDHAYQPEEEARQALWRLAMQRCADGLRYIFNLDGEPETPLAFPPRFADDLHILIGVAALRQEVENHYGLQLSLNDPQHIIGTRHLHWRHIHA